MIILGIETSCDETAAAVVRGEDGKVEVLSSVISSQINIHKKYGGVVPEVAAREHVLNILPVIDKALAEAGIDRFNFGNTSRSVHVTKSPHPPLLKGVIDAVAVTVGPGLITSLIVGVETAKTLSYVWNLPIVAVNHIEGHIYANFVGVKSKIPLGLSSGRRQNPKSKIKDEKNKLVNDIKFPAIVLTVSGGHTMLVFMKGHGRLKVIGDTLDDAAGEAFDKAAQMLGVGYPGGPAIAKMAAKYDSRVIPPPPFIPPSLKLRRTSKGVIKLPRPMLDAKNFDFSFSGLKTALLYQLKKDKNWKKRIPEYCHELQQAIIDVLITKTIKAAKKYNVKTIMLAGGVAANIKLRQQLTDSVRPEIPEAKLLIPDLAYTTDNAAMVAAAGYFKAKKGKFTPRPKLKADSNYKF